MDKGTAKYHIFNLMADAVDAGVSPHDIGLNLARIDRTDINSVTGIGDLLETLEANAVKITRL